MCYTDCLKTSKILIKWRYFNNIFDIFPIFIFTENMGEFRPTSWW
jgi:hypothetical protein